MDLMQSADQDAIQETVRSFLAKELPPDKVRALFDAESIAGLDHVWRQAGDLGFFGLGLSEDRGGSGFSLTEEMIVFNEVGRTLVPGPWLGSVLAAHSLNDDALRAQVLSGETPCAIVVAESEDSVTVADGRITVSIGRASDVEFASALLLFSGGSLWFVERDDDWTAGALRSFDPTRRVYSLHLDGARCRELCRGQAADQLLRRATILACAEAVGGIESTVEMSVEYCKVRTQFGQPIGSFQAVKHRCADMAVRAEVARSATIYATVCVRDGRDDAGYQLSTAKLLCTDAYLRNGADNIQNHGGMGFTWECDAHLYMKRAHGFDQTFGARVEHLDSLVTRLRAADG